MAETADRELEAAAGRLAERLRRVGSRVVFAESCTAGLVSAALGRVAGISEWLCGSAVTYRIATKTEWLKVSDADLRRHTAVSEPVARQMAWGVLQATPEADWAASVTGHLGPQAPDGLDGVVYISIAWRRHSGPQQAWIRRLSLKNVGRLPRQQEAATEVLQTLDARIAATLQPGEA